MSKERTDKLYGPYKHGKRWRLVRVSADGTRTYESEGDGGETGFSTREAAEEFKAGWELAGEERKLSSAVDEYLDHLQARGKRPGTVTTVSYRLRGLLRLRERDRLLRSVTPRVARELFKLRCNEVTTDTQVGELATMGAFAAWCVKQGWIAADPFDGISAEGERARGKLQLRINEARRFVAAALDEDSWPGLAAAMALLMGMRASEVTGRTVRDVDDGARVLWIDRAKTRKGERHLEIPEVLRPRLVKLCGGRAGHEPLFGDVDRHWLGYHVRRLCGVARVPVVCPHGLRGTQASIAVRAIPAEHVAEQLGQTGPAVTRRHYLAAGAEADGRQRAAMRVLQGPGK